ncbi:minor tail protein [Enterococcus phage EF_FB]
MERAQVKVDYTVNETGQYGWSSLHARGVHSQLMNKDGTINSFSALASDGLSIQDSQGDSGFLSAELLMQFANTGKKIYPGNSWVTNTDRIIPSLTMDQCAIGWLFLWQPYDTTGGQPYTWDYTYYLVPKAHAIFNNGKGINMRLQGAGSGGGTNDIVYKYVYVSNISISGTANNGTGNGAKWVLTSVFSV